MDSSKDDAKMQQSESSQATSLWETMVQQVAYLTAVNPAQELSLQSEHTADLVLEVLAIETINVETKGGAGMGRLQSSTIVCHNEVEVNASAQKELLRLQAALPAAVDALAQQVKDDAKYLTRVRHQGLVDLLQPRSYGVASTCSSCGGKGKSSCAQCGGAKRTTCPQCQGTRTRTCSGCGGSAPRCLTCNGRGTQHTEAMDNNNLDRLMRPCTPCNGAGFLRCYSCQGRGSVQCSCSDGKASCSGCSGTGSSACQPCGNTGSLRYEQRTVLSTAFTAQIENWQQLSGQIDHKEALKDTLRQKLPVQDLAGWAMRVHGSYGREGTAVQSRYALQLPLREISAIWQRDGASSTQALVVHVLGAKEPLVDAHGLIETLLSADQQAVESFAAKRGWAFWKQRVGSDWNALRRWHAHPLVADLGQGSARRYGTQTTWAQHQNAVSAEWLAQAQALSVQAGTAARNKAGKWMLGLFVGLAVLAPAAIAVLRWPFQPLEETLVAGAAVALAGMVVVPLWTRWLLSRKLGAPVQSWLDGLLRAGGHGKPQGGAKAAHDVARWAPVLGLGGLLMACTLVTDWGISQMPVLSQARSEAVEDNHHYYQLHYWSTGPQDYNQRGIPPREWVTPLIAEGDEKARMITAWGNLLQGLGLKEGTTDPRYAKQLLDGATPETRKSLEWKAAMGVAVARHQLGSSADGLRWLKEAAQEGHVHAMYELGDWLYDRQRGQYQPNEGIRWLTKAYEAKHGSAGLRLALAQMYGEAGFKPDARKALEIYSKVTTYGLPRSREFLDEYQKRKR